MFNTNVLFPKYFYLWLIKSMDKDSVTIKESNTFVVIKRWFLNVYGKAKGLNIQDNLKKKT